MVTNSSMAVEGYNTGKQSRPSTWQATQNRQAGEVIPSAIVRDARWRAVLDRDARQDGRFFSLPLEVRATAFQSRVWKHLQTIPPGTTQSYGEIAEAVGQPTATRAVARACATNPVAIVIPCHRVIRQDGGLGGYRWGLKRREKLLTQERRRYNSRKSGHRPKTTKHS